MQVTGERGRRGGEGHRVSGDTAGSRFQNRPFRGTKVEGANVGRLWIAHALGEVSSYRSKLNNTGNRFVSLLRCFRTEALLRTPHESSTIIPLIP